MRSKLRRDHQKGGVGKNDQQRETSPAALASPPDAGFAYGFSDPQAHGGR